MASLREKQIASLEQMLNLNVSADNVDLTAPTAGNEEIIWKVLILDQKSTAVVSSVLRVNDLLRCGVTFHSLINAKRAALPDVPAIYFVEPTLDNIKFIIDDVSNDVYSAFYVNFTSTIERSVLEEFAKQIAMTGKSDRIKKLFDQYTDFIVTEPNLFSLDLKNVYSQIYNPKVDEQDLDKIIDNVANGICHCLITLKQIPIIRCPKNGPAEMVAIKLEQKLRDYVLNTKTHSSTSSLDSLQRTVLVLLDRNFDLSAMFAHSWIYQCLVSDVFHLSRNTITLEIVNENGVKTKNQYDIDPKDFFWSRNALSPFPEVVEDVDAELAKYKQDAEELTAKTGYSSLTDIDPNSTTDTVHIQQAIKALPELTARKNILDMHMKVLTALLNQLGSKKLDSFFEVEQKFNDPKVEKEFLDALDLKVEGDNLNDKLRTFLILVLMSNLPKTFETQVENKLKEQGIQNLGALNYIRRVKEVTNLSYMSNATQQASHMATHQNNTALFNGLSSRLYGLTEGRISEGVGSLITGLKKLLPEKKQMPITNIVESIMDPQNSKNVSLTDDYLYFDPKSTRGSHSQKPKRQSYNESIVFVVGGGNYLEYSNLQEWVISTGSGNTSNGGAGSNAGQNSYNSGNRSVIYGSTNIITADEFLQECNELGTAA